MRPVLIPDAWRTVFRLGIAPHLSTASLRALHDALERNDPALIQGRTVQPRQTREQTVFPPVEGACATCFPAWKVEGFASTAEAHRHFSQLREKADATLANLYGPRLYVSDFVVFWDTRPREVVFPLLLAVVKEILRERGSHAD